MIDIHTHNKTSANFTKVINYSMDNCHEINTNNYFSAGIHPWYLNDFEQQQNKLISIANDKNCIAIGECGLDKACSTSIELQKIAFIYQCEVANKHKKPMIIHCVKAHFETIKILKEQKIKKAIFHGFNNRYTNLEKILQEGYFVSFGEAILNEKSQAHALLKMVPNDKYFLETDESSNTIETIYNMASSILGIDLEKIIQQQEINFNNFKQT